MILRAVRHIVVAPMFCLVVIVAIVASPVLVVGAALFSMFVDRQFRPVRAIAFVLIYAVHDVIVVLAGFALWLRLGGRGAMNDERMQSSHYRLIAWFLGRISRAAEAILGVRFVVEHSEQAEALLSDCATPLIMLSRHAGPGDSFLLVQELLARGRRPRIVLRAALQLDPGIDLLGNRLPFCFVSRTTGSTDATCARIADLARTMDSRSALVLFPEGATSRLSAVKTQFALCYAAATAAMLTALRTWSMSSPHVPAESSVPSTQHPERT